MTTPDAPQNPPAAPGGWAPPGAPPFGTPSGAAPASSGAYAPPAGYAAPQGFGMPAAPAAPSRPPAPSRHGSGLGLTALVLALVATLGATVGGAIAGFNIGLGAGKGLAYLPMDGSWDWSILTPVRDWVLLGEVSFWFGTVLGVWALVQGIVATVSRRGRGLGIAAIVVAAIGPIVFGGVVQGVLMSGLAAGTGIGG
ncbi:hypothetical protein IF188_11915 [Microbacterium sp. NEAU-LLC]|uniref:Yip1 domain-containing protein n=1 Tax=Microbacterium helvum TaxID=2773713 RepID=A0ABR8NP25_9MICO|nr:hypothetical protein [Microbacterium helvum]MBD3942405.1 hypothetical protein [Microbacterium helvum]